MYRYKVYGLNVASDILLPELDYSRNKQELIDVKITYKCLPEEVIKGRAINGQRCYRKGIVWFYIPKVATYCMLDGKEIRVKVDEGASESRVRAFLLGRAMGMLMFQREMIIIHGGAVNIDGKGVIITGVSGAGKSSLLTELIMEGYSFLTDDVVAISKGTDNLMNIQVAYPLRKLCHDTIRKMAYSVDVNNILEFTKSKCAIMENDKFQSESIPVSAMYEIVIGENLNIEKLKGMRKIETLMNNDYWMSSLAKKIGMPRKSMKQFIELAEQIDVYTITRPADQFLVKEQLNLIRESLM